MTRYRICAAALLAASCVAPIETATVEQHDTSMTSTLKEGSDWLGVYFNYAQAVSLIISMFGDSAEDVLHDDLVRLYETMTELEVEVAALGGEILSAEMEKDVSDVGVDSYAARRDLRTYGTVPPANATNYLFDSMQKTQRLLNVDEYWHRLFVDAATFGEWRTITAYRPPVVGGRVWDYRFALPALLDAVPMRISTLLAADPTQLKAGTYNTELAGYRTKLIDTMSTIEGNLQCGFQIAGDLHGGFTAADEHITYHVHAICGDPFTGTEVTAVQDVDDTNPREVWTPFGASFSVFTADTDAVGGSVTLFAGNLRARFWSQLGDNPFVRTWMDETLRDIRAQLRTKLGLFEIRRAIDSLYTVIHRDPGPIAIGRVHSGISGLCLANQLSLSGGYNWVVTQTCDRIGAHTWGQVWTYDPVAAQFRSSDAGACLAIPGNPDVPMLPTVVTTCNPADEAQRWSYDPEVHRIRNAQTYVLDVYNATATPGAMVWTYWENGSAAQQWGFNYTIGGGRGPGL